MDGDDYTYPRVVVAAAAAELDALRELYADRVRDLKFEHGARLAAEAKLDAALTEREFALDMRYASLRKAEAERDALRAQLAAVPVAAIRRFFNEAGDHVVECRTILTWLDTLSQPEVQP